MTKRDYYDILGVGQSAGEQEIKSAYRQLALKYHPDRNAGDKQAEENFKEAAEAYSVLSDPQRRAAYDRYGHQGVSAAAASGFDPDIFADFSDILGGLFGFPFADLFGGGPRGRSYAQRGDDVRYDLEIGFEDAMRGMTAEIQVPRQEPCRRCSGHGAEPDGMATCPACHGRGEILFHQGFLTVRRTCPQCRGAGRTVHRACPQCLGNGYVRTERKLKVNLPAGVDNGTHLRLAGEGQPGVHGGPPGDLYVVLKVEEHPFFERRDNNLYCTIPLNVAQAALGADVEVPTLDGSQPLRIPEGVQSGATFRLRNQGVPQISGRGRGDLIVQVQVTTPTKLTREQRKLLEELGATLPQDNAPNRKGLFEKVKDYFM